MKRSSAVVVCLLAGAIFGSTLVWALTAEQETKLPTSEVAPIVTSVPVSSGAEESDDRGYVSRSKYRELQPDGQTGRTGTRAGERGVGAGAVRRPSSKKRAAGFRLPAPVPLAADYVGEVRLLGPWNESGILPRPTALAADDFDEDGVPDLVSGYTGAAGHLLTLHRGNVDAIYSHSPGAKQPQGGGDLHRRRLPDAGTGPRSPGDSTGLRRRGRLRRRRSPGRRDRQPGRAESATCSPATASAACAKRAACRGRRAALPRWSRARSTGATVWPTWSWASPAPMALRFSCSRDREAR